MRRLALLLLTLPAFAHADRLVNVPVATKLTTGTFRYEDMVGLSDSRVLRKNLLYAVDDTLEIEARHWRSGGGDFTTFDAYATLISPFKGVAPGIAAGVRDVLNESDDGRRFWIAFTFREPFQVGEFERGFDLTIGGFVGPRGSALVGLSIPFGPDLRLLAEHDGIRAAAGIQYAPIRNLELRLITEERATLGSARYSFRF